MSTKWRPKKKSPLVLAKSDVRLMGYVRVSTEEQAVEGYSVDAQNQILTDYVLKNGYHLVDVVKDEGVSGTIEAAKRDGYQALLARMDAGDANGIIFWKIDRLGRNAMDILNTAAEFQQQGRHFISVTDQFDSVTPMGKIWLHFTAMLAQLEVDRTGERTSMALRHMGRENRINSFWAPYGYRFEDGTFRPLKRVEGMAADKRPLVKYEPEQSVLAEMMRLAADGKNNYAISKTLNAAGIYNTRTGKQWHPTSVKVILNTAKARIKDTSR